MTIDRPDTLLAELSELAPLAPGQALDGRIRARCHAALTAGTATPQAIVCSGRGVLDGLLALAVVAYGVAILVEGLQVIGVI